MTPEQHAAVDQAVAARVNPALELYAVRNVVAFHIYKLSLEDLKRLAAALPHFPIADLVPYAEGLADFCRPVQESKDAPAVSPTVASRR